MVARVNPRSNPLLSLTAKSAGGRRSAPSTAGGARSSQINDAPAATRTNGSAFKRFVEQVAARQLELRAAQSRLHAEMQALDAELESLLSQPIVLLGEPGLAGAPLDREFRIPAASRKASQQRLDQGSTVQTSIAPSVESELGLAGAEWRGQQALARWVVDGTLTPSAVFARGWGITRQALEAATKRGELFSIKVGNKAYYPSRLLPLARSDVTRVCRALDGLASSEKLLFWLGTHGAIGGATGVDAVAAGLVERVVMLATDLASERRSRDADSTT